MAIKTINGILKTDSAKTSDEFNSDILTACNNAESLDTANNYVGLVFNLKDKRIDFVPSDTVSSNFSVNSTTIVDGSSGTDVEDEYIRATATPISVGGVTAGTTFDGTVSDALDKVLYPYVKPTFSSFYLSSQVTSLEVGDKIIGGSRTFNWGTTTSENITSDTIKITSGSTTLIENATDNGSVSIDIGDDIVKTNSSSNYFYIYATDTQGDTISRIFAVYWKWRLYYGSSSLEIIDADNVKSLQNSFLYTTENYTYSTPAENYKWICYPKTFGLASKFTDIDTGFSVAMENPQTISITNDFGVSTDYYCYRTTNSLTGAVNIKIG